MLDCLAKLSKPIPKDEIDPRVDKYFKQKSHCVSINGYEPDDVYQELCLKWWLVLPKFDPTKSSIIHYAHIVGESVVKDLFKQTHRQKRGNGVPTESLEDLIEQEKN